MVGWQSDLINTKESVGSVSSKSYHTNIRKIQQRGENKVLRNCTLR